MMIRNNNRSKKTKNPLTFSEWRILRIAIDRADACDQRFTWGRRMSLFDVSLAICRGRLERFQSKPSKHTKLRREFLDQFKRDADELEDFPYRDKLRTLLLHKAVEWAVQQNDMISILNRVLFPGPRIMRIELVNGRAEERMAAIEARGL